MKNSQLLPLSLLVLSNTGSITNLAVQGFSSPKVYIHHHHNSRTTLQNVGTSINTKVAPLSYAKDEDDLNSPSRNSNSIDQEALQQLKKCKTGTSARRLLERSLPSAPDNQNSPLYQSVQIPKGASSLTISDADLAIQTNIRNAKYSIMELIELNGDKDADRASLALFCLFWSTSISAIVAQQSLPGPEIIRFVVVWALCFSPLIFVGYGLATPDSLQGLLISLQRNVFPTYRKRMMHHEAGHFLMAHLLGFPIKGYQANAVKNAVEFYPLRDNDVGKEKASLLGFDNKRNSRSIDQLREDFDYDKDYFPEDYMGDVGEPKPYFSEGGRGENTVLTQSVFRNDKNYTDNPFLKVAPSDDVAKSWPYRGFDHDTIDQLAVVSVAGVCSEILAFGNAEGGFADLAQLRSLFNAAEPGLSEKEMENRIRFALGFGMGQLRRHLGALDALVEAMEGDKSVADCVVAIETCENVSGATVMGNYEKLRKEKIQNEGAGFLERLLLSGGKNADTEDNSVIEGKGGGDRKEGFQLTGDDPLYAALGVALLFFAYASSGGLSLH
jgi:hypothetical protein